MYLPSSKFYHFSFKKDTKGKLKAKPQTGENICKHISKKGLHLEFKTFFNSTTRRQTTQSKNGQTLNISSKRMYDSK